MGIKILVKNNPGFTLVEVMIVVAIISILSSFGYASYSQVQSQGNDARRKSDLAQVKSALELYYSVNNAYPSAVNWGAATWSDSNGTYMKSVPQDPKLGISGQPNYCYQATGTPPNSYTLYAKLENSSDRDLKPSVSCGATSYNYYINNPF